jgi:hypothetical protein
LTPLRAEAKSITTKTAAILSSKQTDLKLHSNTAQNTTGVANRRSQTVVTVEGKVLHGD